MNQWKPILLLAKRSLWLLAGVVALSVAVVFGLRYLANHLSNGVAQLQSTLQTQKELQDSREADLRNVRANIQRYQQLREQGLVANPDRPLWLEQLQENHQKLGLVGSLTLQLQAPKPLASMAEPVAEAELPAPLMHDLQFEMRDTLETEVLALIRDYRAQVTGRFRVNACKFHDPKDSGLTAQCVLRFVSIAPPAPATSAASAPASEVPAATASN
jgi:hypothetical protein